MIYDQTCTINNSRFLTDLVCLHELLLLLRRLLDEEKEVNLFGDEERVTVEALVDIVTKREEAKEVDAETHAPRYCKPCEVHVH